MNSLFFFFLSDPVQVSVFAYHWVWQPQAVEGKCPTGCVLLPSDPEDGDLRRQLQAGHPQAHRSGLAADWRRRDAEEMWVSFCEAGRICWW